MIAIFDVYYNNDDTAHGVALIVKSLTDEVPVKVYENTVTGVEPYESGSFYRRELPILLDLIKSIKEPLDLLVVDGYVSFTASHPGLGYHLFQATSIPVIGVAKSEYLSCDQEEKVYRGSSKNPLHVTSIGIPLSQASSLVSSMAGSYRIPTLIKLTDQKTRGICCG